MKILRFVNEDAVNKETILEVSERSVGPIMAWYGAYHAGDTYAVYLDDKELRKDLNGHLLSDTAEVVE